MCLKCESRDPFWEKNFGNKIFPKKNFVENFPKKNFFRKFFGKFGKFSDKI